MSNDKSLKDAACDLARSQPDYAGHSAFPPQAWLIEGEELVVLCADGRKVRSAAPPAAAPKKASAAAIAKELAEDFVQPGQPTPKKAMAPSTDKTSIEAAQSHSPAKHKAG